MTIDEAITEMSNWELDNRLLFSEDHEKAIQLGIEALKWYKDGKVIGWVRTDYLLPGETEGANHGR